jgi:hypothetical protein
MTEPLQDRSTTPKYLFFKSVLIQRKHSAAILELQQSAICSVQGGRFWLCLVGAFL